MIRMFFLALITSMAFAGLLGEKPSVPNGYEKKAKGVFVEKSSGILLRSIEAEGQVVVLDWASPKPFSPTWLWKQLDQEAKGGEWHELFESQEFPESIQKLFHPESKQKWILHTLSGIQALAEVRQSEKGHLLRLADLSGNKFQQVQKPLKLNFENFPTQDFMGNWKQGCLEGKSCKFSHKLQPTLEVETKKFPRITLSYLSEARRFQLPANCYEMPEQDRVEFVESFQLYLDYELMKSINAFVKTLGNVSSWPSWHFWDFRHSYKVSEKELFFYAHQCIVPEQINFLSIPLEKGEMKFYSNLRGAIWVELP